jgi:hypothetical protein
MEFVSQPLSEQRTLTRVAGAGDKRLALVIRKTIPAGWRPGFRTVIGER